MSSLMSATSSTVVNKAQWKNILVVGGSVAGHSFVNSIAPNLPPNYRLIIIERNEFVQHSSFVVRALVAPGWENGDFTAPMNQHTVFPINSRHRVVCPNRVVKLRRNTVWLEHEFEGSDEIEFEKCVIATGAQSPVPIRPAPGSTLEQWKDELRLKQAEIKDAKSILIVGGGSVGIEVAGEIYDLYGRSKKITIVHWDVGLLHPSDSGANTKHTYVPPRTSMKLVSALQRQLTARGVEFVLCDRVDFSAAEAEEWGGKSGALGEMKRVPLVSGRYIMADYVFDSTGNKPNSQLVSSVDPGAVTTNGYVSIDSMFRIRGSHPQSIFKGQYYALGDVANAPSWKTGVAAMSEGEALAKIMAAEIKGWPAKPYAPSSKLKESTVLLGSRGGAAIINLPIIGNIRAPDFVVDRKSRDFLADKIFFSRFRQLGYTDSTVNLG